MSTERPPTWYWLVAGLLLVWNLMGLAAFFYDGLMSEEAMAQLPQAHQELYAARPGWVVMAFGSAVVAGTAACVALLMRRKVATGLFVVSLLSVLVQDSWFFLGGVIDVMGTQAIVMPVLVIGSLVGGLVLARQGTAKGWLA